MKPFKTKRKGAIAWFIQNSYFYVLGKTYDSGCGIQIVDVQILSYISEKDHVCSNVHVGFFFFFLYADFQKCKDVQNRNGKIHSC